MFSQGVSMELRRKNSDAFTMIEMIIVITILGGLMLIAMPALNWYQNLTARTTTKSNLKMLRQAIQNFHIETRGYPVTLDDLIRKPTDPNLAKNWSEPLLESKDVPLDGWNEPFKYRVTKGGTHPFELYSEGNPEKPSKIDVWDL